MTQNSNSIVIQSRFLSVIQSEAKNLTILFLTLLLNSCTPYTEPSPSTERAIYPTECDYSTIEFGTLKIYDTDSTYLYSIALDHQYVPSSVYCINLDNGT